MNNENFKEYMEFFKNQSLKDKQQILYDQMKMLAGITNNMCEVVGAKNELLVNKELNDLNNKNYTEDDFAEAMIVLLNSIQNSICDFSNRVVDIVEKIEI